MYDTTILVADHISTPLQLEACVRHDLAGPKGCRTNPPGISTTSVLVLHLISRTIKLNCTRKEKKKRSNATWEQVPFRRTLCGGFLRLSACPFHSANCITHRHSSVHACGRPVEWSTRGPAARYILLVHVVHLRVHVPRGTANPRAVAK